MAGGAISPVGFRLVGSPKANATQAHVVYLPSGDEQGWFAVRVYRKSRARFVRALVQYLGYHYPKSPLATDSSSLVAANSASRGGGGQSGILPIVCFSASACNKLLKYTTGLSALRGTPKAGALCASSKGVRWSWQHSSRFRTRCRLFIAVIDCMRVQHE